MNYTYKQIWLINFPVMMSILMEQLINITDAIFLGHVGEVELGASALASVYYLAIYMLGFGFSLAGLLEEVLGLVLVLRGPDGVLVQILGHIVTGGGHVVGAGGPHRRVLGFIIPVRHRPAHVRDENGPRCAAGVHLIILKAVDHRSAAGAGGDHTHHGERHPVDLDGAADGVLALEQRLCRLRVDQRHIPPVLIVRRREGASVVHRVVHGRQIVAAQLADSDPLNAVLPTL